MNLERKMNMKDSKGNKFGVGHTLVSSECPDTDPGITCKSIAGNLAVFKHNFDYGMSPESFLLTQKSLDNSKWIIKK